MVLRRALFGTALGLSLAGCAVQTASSGLSPSVVEANRSAAHSMAATGVQVASLQGDTMTDAAQPPVVRQGTVLWHRNEAAEEAYRPELSKELQILSQRQAEAEARQREAEARQAATEARLAQVKGGLEKVSENQLQAVGSVAKLAQSSLDTMSQSAQLAELRAREFASTQAQTAEQRAKAFTGTQLAAVEQRTKAFTGTQVAEAEQRAKAFAGEQAAMASAQVAAVSNQVEEATQRNSEVTGAQVAAVSAQVAAEKRVAQAALPGQVSEILRSVVTKDDKVVFAINKAVDERLQQAVAEHRQAAATRLGPDRKLALREGKLGGDLSIGSLLEPDGTAAASDAALAAISPAAGASTTLPVSNVVSLQRARRPSAMDIRQYKVVLHEDGKPLGAMFDEIMQRAEPFVGPWQVKWKLSPDNAGLVNEKFSLDTETDFDEFVSYLSQYIMNDRGVKLSFSLFDNERIIVISD